MRALRHLLPALCGAVLLAGCATTQLGSDGGDDSTGDLGSPTARQSPADVYIDLSGAYLRENQLTEAFKNAKKAVLVDPRSSNAHFVLGLVQQRLGQPEAAEAAYRKAISLDPRNPVALNAYGSFLCENQRFDEADGYFRRALQNPLYETPWLALHNAGRCQELAGNRKAAETDFRAALTANPRFAPSLLSMARLSVDEGSHLSARAYLQRYAEVAPHTAESLWLGVRTEQALGDKDQMSSYVLKLKARFPDSEQARYVKNIE